MSKGYLNPVYRLGFGKKGDTLSWNKEALNYLHSSTKNSTKERKELGNQNRKSSEKHSLTIWKCEIMSIDIDSIIQEELERLESQQNQNKTSEAADNAAEV